MREKLKIFISVVCFCFVSLVYGQDKPNNIYRILDTLDIRQNRFTLSVQWKNDTVNIRQSVKSDERDTILVKEEKVILSYGPNCFAHALDSYFKFNEMNKIDLFGKRTVIFGEDLMKILNNSFSKVQEFQVNRKKLKNARDINVNSILVFKNQYEMVIHAIYYADNGLFYTKNGMFPVQQFSDINKIIKTYWDTKTIDVYQLTEF